MGSGGLQGNTATVKKDEWGFRIANFSRTLPFGRDSFAFPSQVEQVFFSDCVEAPGWKVLIQTEPRGRRVVAAGDDVDGGLLFRHGRDAEYPGLQVPDDLHEGHAPVQRAGRVVRVLEELGEEAPDEGDTFDHDLGESSVED